MYIKPPEVSFRENWLRDQNRQRDGKINSQQDMDRIWERISVQIVFVLESEFVERGYEVVSAGLSPIAYARDQHAGFQADDR